MKNTSVFTLLMCLAGLNLALNGSACTTFCMKNSDNHIIFGRNFDFPAGMGNLEINHRAQVKTAFIPLPEKPFSWTSKYGSISFNQIGREFPYGGMNEAGLVIEQMWHEDAVYPVKDDRFALTELQWIQYQLDNASCVDDVIQSDAWLRISFLSTATLHFLVADASGNTATIEYLDGNMVVHSGVTLPYPVLANCSYEVSIDYRNKKESGSNESFTGQTENSSGRFAKAADMIHNQNSPDDKFVDYGFSILTEVSQGAFTQWSIIYDITEKSIYYRTNKNKAIRTIKLAEFDFACNNQALRIDINEDRNQPGAFLPADFAGSYQLINEVCNNVEFLKGMPEEPRKAIAAFGLAVVCK